MTELTFHLSYSAMADLCDGRLGRRDVPCPFCGPWRRAPENRRRRVLRLCHPEPSFASFYCARCGERGWARQNDGCDHHAAVQPRLRHEDDQDQKRRVEIAIQIWGASIPLYGTRGWRYFTEQRGLHVGDLDDLCHAVRWNEKAQAIIALMTDSASNEPTGVHRTFLNPDATKRERKMLGRQGVVRLSRDENVIEGLGIAEGIEDGLAVLLSGWAPIWAATSAGAIARFPVLHGIEHLIIFADADDQGVKAAKSCAERWIAAGHEAKIAVPGGRAP